MFTVFVFLFLFCFVFVSFCSVLLFCFVLFLFVCLFCFVFPQRKNLLHEQRFMTLFNFWVVINGL